MNKQLLILDAIKLSESLAEFGLAVTPTLSLCLTSLQSLHGDNCRRDGIASCSRKCRRCTDVVDQDQPCLILSLISGSCRTQHIAEKHDAQYGKQSREFHRTGIDTRSLLCPLDRPISNYRDCADASQAQTQEAPSAESRGRSAAIQALEWVARQRWLQE